MAKPINCEKCGKKLAERDGDYIVIRGNSSLRIYDSSLVVIDCSRCSQKLELRLCVVANALSRR